MKRPETKTEELPPHLLELVKKMEESGWTDPNYRPEYKWVSIKSKWTTTGEVK